MPCLYLLFSHPHRSFQGLPVCPVVIRRTWRKSRSWWVTLDLPAFFFYCTYFYPTFELAVLSIAISLSFAKTTEREVTAKIKAGGGEVLESFAALDQHRRTNSQVLLISFSYLRTPKYMEALALNVPRLSYRWIDACTEDVGSFSIVNSVFVL